MRQSRVKGYLRTVSNPSSYSTDNARRAGKTVLDTWSSRAYRECHERGSSSTLSSGSLDWGYVTQWKWAFARDVTTSIRLRLRRWSRLNPS